MTEYETWTETIEPRGLEREKFNCDCGRELVVERTECDRCGAHYDYQNGEVVQVAPPIEGLADTDIHSNQ